MSYGRELQVAELAVQRAALLTKKASHHNTKGAFSKNDRSPVTIADFGAQALIIHALQKAYPHDEVVGEEEASTLRDNVQLRDQVWELVKAARLEDAEAETILGGPVENIDAMLNAIDAGNSAGGAKGRIWALDPVDGTDGFLRGDQYAICLALIVDGVVKVGVLGCPNLPMDDQAQLRVNQKDGEHNGVLFAAVEGQGATSRHLGRGTLQKSTPIALKEIADITQATLCESVERNHSSHNDQSIIAKRLGITKPTVRIDSQAKYGSVARGAVDLYLRLPVRKDYQEKIWDHAAGDLIVREAGGIVTDMNGMRLNFGKGRTLTDNKGIVAASKTIHACVLEVVQDVLSNK